MYKEIAVAPTCLADDACFFTLRAELGFEKGRYLVADGPAWFREAMAAVKSAQSRNELKPIRARTIKEWLNKMGRRVGSRERQVLLPRDRVLSSGTEPWRDWWAEQNKIRSFDVCVDEISNPPEAYDFTELMGISEWQVHPTYTIDRKADKIVPALVPLLRISKEVLLFDDYFYLSNNKVLAELLNAADKVGCRKITIVTACDCASAEKVWSSEYQPLVSADFKCVWMKAPEKYIHDRYLITDTGAVKAGHGFSEGAVKGAPSDQVSLSYCSFVEALSTKQHVQALVDDGRASHIWSN